MLLRTCVATDTKQKVTIVVFFGKMSENIEVFPYAFKWNSTKQE